MAGQPPHLRQPGVQLLVAHDPVLGELEAHLLRCRLAEQLVADKVVEHRARVVDRPLQHLLDRREIELVAEDRRRLEQLNAFWWESIDPPEHQPGDVGPPGSSVAPSFAPR